MRLAVGTIAAALITAQPASAQSDAFRPGPVIAEYGAIAPVEADAPIPPGSRFRISFDVSAGAEPGARNRQLESAARLLNMLAEAGVSPDRVNIAIVVHGSATFDLMRPQSYAARKEGAVTGNAGLITALLRHGVDIQLCGQSAAAHGVGREELIPGVRMALSAMTAHALLQQQGYTINPF